MSNINATYSSPSVTSSSVAASSGYNLNEIYANEIARITGIPNNSEVRKLHDSIKGILIKFVNKNKDKAAGIVKKLPMDKPAELKTLETRLNRICKDKGALAKLKDALHYKGSQPKQTYRERLKIRATALFALALAKDDTSIDKQLAVMSEARKICDIALPLVQLKHTSGLAYHTVLQPQVGLIKNGLNMVVKTHQTATTSAAAAAVDLEPAYALAAQTAHNML